MEVVGRFSSTHRFPNLGSVQVSSSFLEKQRPQAMKSLRIFLVVASKLAEVLDHRDPAGKRRHT